MKNKTWIDVEGLGKDGKSIICRPKKVSWNTNINFYETFSNDIYDRHSPLLPIDILKSIQYWKHINRKQ